MGFVFLFSLFLIVLLKNIINNNLYVIKIRFVKVLIC